MLATIVSQFSLNFFVHKENEKEMSLSAVWRVRSSEQAEPVFWWTQTPGLGWAPHPGLARPLRPDPGPGRANSGGKEATIDVKVSGLEENHKSDDGGDEVMGHKRQTSLNYMEM